LQERAIFSNTSKYAIIPAGPCKTIKTYLKPVTCFQNGMTHFSISHSKHYKTKIMI
jgi:hypothetical protein